MFSRRTIGMWILFWGVMSVAKASPYRSPMYSDIRWLGRGNTGVALISDGTAAFYNPGGLGKTNAYNISFLNPAFGGNSDIYSAATSLLGSNPQTITDYFQPLLGKPLGGQVSVFPYLRVPHFMAGYFAVNTDMFNFHNPVAPELQVNYRYDRGVIFGGGVDILDKLFVGASLRFQRRSMIQDTFGGALIATASLDTLLRDISKGDGWGLNMGAQYRYDISSSQALHLGVAFDDLGRTMFRPERVGTGTPAMQATYTSAGMAYTGQIPGLSYALLLDLTNLGDSSQSYSKKIQIGGEVSLPLVTLRGGSYQGYWTAGFSVAIFPFINLDATTYAQELGIVGGQQSSRFYMIGLQMGIDLSEKNKRKQKYTLDHL